MSECSTALGGAGGGGGCGAEDVSVLLMAMQKGKGAEEGMGALHSGITCVITPWDFYVCRWEEITIWLMNGEKQSDIATVTLSTWTVGLI